MPANRLRIAVERTVPFVMQGLTILVLWYQQHETATHDLAVARARGPWNRRKIHISVDYVLIAFRRARIAAISSGCTCSPSTPRSCSFSMPVNIRVTGRHTRLGCTEAVAQAQTLRTLRRQQLLLGRAQQVSYQGT
jgi:hypothetical protein